eukprot:scaffold5777_cov101-Isochrysis_galbana.AAC.2
MSSCACLHTPWDASIGDGAKDDRRDVGVEHAPDAARRRRGVEPDVGGERKPIRRAREAENRPGRAEGVQISAGVAAGGCGGAAGV